MTRFEHGGREFFLRFDWNPPERADGVFADAARVIVACVVSATRDGPPLGPHEFPLAVDCARGLAIVHPSDARRWSREKGRRIALTRALVPLPREFRRLAWRAYLAPFTAREMREKLIGEMTRAVLRRSGDDVVEELRRWRAAKDAGLTKPDTQPRPEDGPGGDARAMIARLARKHVRRYARRALAGRTHNANVDVHECVRLLCLWLDVEDNGYRVDGLGPEHLAEVRDAVEDEESARSRA